MAESGSPPTSAATRWRAWPLVALALVQVHAQPRNQVQDQAPVRVAAAAPASAVNRELAASWAVDDGYSLGVLAAGFSLPTSLAGVPAPGAQPGAPKLFVTELRGTIKVVANDNSVTEFDRIPTLAPKREWPDWEGEAGMAGICLAPEQGYVFVTYAYRDDSGILRNGITRLRAQPHTLAGKVQERRDIGGFLAAEPSALSHQIGNCVVHGGFLYVAIGDAGHPALSTKVESPLGKVLRLTLDGDPAPGNPFPGAAGVGPRVYTFGLRNPFGLAFAGERLFAAENGISLDRFIELGPGRNLNWNGSDASIATNAAAVFVPTIGPAQMVHAPPRAAGLSPSEHDRFLIAASNGTQGPGVVVVDYALQSNMVAAAPRYLARYLGRETGMAVAGVSMVREGVAFVPILPVAGTGVVLVARYAPAAEHATTIAKSVRNLLAANNCMGCHSRDGVGGQVGPSLDRNSLMTRVETRVLNASYAQQLARLDAINDPEVAKGRKARRKVLDTAPDQRARAWIVERLLHPKFDQLDAQMPDLGLDRATAEALALELAGPSGWQQKVLALLVERRFQQGVLAGGAAVGALAVVSLVGIGLRRRLRRRRRAAAQPDA